MTFNIDSRLDSGQISSILEVCTIVLGLFITSDLQSIVSLSARRRLYSRGTARLRDSTWNVSVIEGVTSPRRLLRDFRALAAFIIASLIISLEVLVVLQTTSIDTWVISKSAQKCYKPTPEVEGGNTSSLASSKYVSFAMEKMAQADLTVKIPVNTNVFEDCIITGQAVRQLVSEGKEAVFSAPVAIVKSVVADSFTMEGIPYISLVDLNVGSVFNDTTCMQPYGNEERKIWILRRPEYSGFQGKVSPWVTSSVGFVGIEPCLDNLIVRVCDFVGGRQHFQNEDRLRETKSRVECKIHEISREGRKTDAFCISSYFYGSDPIDTRSIRRALLTSIIAQNSASSTDCLRYVAVPKKVTQIGWISIAAILILISLVILSSGLRIGLTIMSHGNEDYNGSLQRLVETLFMQFAASKSNYCAPRPPIKKSLMFSEPPESEEICMSIVNDASGHDSHHIAWTRGPYVDAEPGSFILSNSIFPRADSAVSDTGERDFDVLPN